MIALLSLIVRCQDIVLADALESASRTRLVDQALRFLGCQFAMTERPEGKILETYVPEGN